MPTRFMIGGDEDPLSRAEQREWDRIQFEAIIAPYVGNALFSPERIRAEMSLVDQVFVSFDLPDDNQDKPFG